MSTVLSRSIPFLERERERSTEVRRREDGSDAEAEDVCGARACRHGLMPHRWLWYVPPSPSPESHFQIACYRFLSLSPNPNSNYPNSDVPLNMTSTWFLSITRLTIMFEIVLMATTATIMYLRVKIIDLHDREKTKLN